MVKKRTALHRIESIMRKKPKLSSIPESSCSLNTQKEKNALNDRILNLYMKNIPANDRSPLIQNKKVVSESGTESEPEKIESAKKPKATNKAKRTIEEKKTSVLKHSTLSFRDVGGLDKMLKKITKLFRHFIEPQLLTGRRRPVRGFLLHGPPGCGKTHLVQVIAGALSLPYIEVVATDLVCGISGESESKIRDVFDEAVKSAPCILFIDEIEAISPKRETTDRGMERRMVTQMIKSFDELNEKDSSSHVMVIGATSRPDFIETALRRSGRFEREFAIGMPNESARLKILEIFCKTLKLSPDFDMQWLAHHTPGYVGADLEGLVTEADEIGRERMYEKFINSSYTETQLGDKNILLDFKSISELDLEELWYKYKIRIPEEELFNFCVEQQDFEVALKNCVPYSKREGFATVPNITWDDVGALEDVKKLLQMSIMWPVKYPKFYEDNIPCTKGIFLYGPKGCGKTLLAKAIANECSLNFLSVKGPEFLNMYLGESEKAVRQCFQRARNSAPCIIFFDEFDALCPKRTGSNATSAADRVVNQLLTELDGIEEREQVFVLGATNRLENIDSAMLRPGRLEEIIYVDIPSPEDRIEILKRLTKNKTSPKISEDVDLKLIALDHRCNNFSGADLARLVRIARNKAIEERIKSADCSLEECLEINMSHFEHAFTKVIPSITETERQHFLKVYKSCLCK